MIAMVVVGEDLSNKDAIAKAKIRGKSKKVFKKLLGELQMKWFLSFFKWERKDPIVEYLSQSIDLVDLEQREKNLKYNNFRVKYWL